MKKKLIFAKLFAIVSLVAVTVPFSWLFVDPGMERSEVYSQCGESTDRCATDAASEVWEKETLYGEWVMFVSFSDDHAVKSSIFLDLGEAEGNCTRISVRKDGQWRFSLSGLTLVF